MKLGGNQKCQSYLSSNGIMPATPIKEKYESDAAQLYKEILKARAEGRPEPTELVKKPPRNPPARNMSSISSGGGGAAPKAGEDPNGMERLTGESDDQYVARQTRLRAEAKARMAAKFGGGGMGGGGRGNMGGVGSDPNYNPNGYGGTDFDANAIAGSVLSGLGSAFGAMSTAASSVTSAVQDEGTKRQVSDFASTVTSSAGGFWSQFSTGASSLVNNITAPEEGDGLSELQQQFHSQRSVNPNSKYSGFGSEMAGPAGGGSSFYNKPVPVGAPPTPTHPTGTLTEAVPAPGEDANGIERLSGESDEQYVMRQTRLRDEAKARMAAKFGGGGMSGVGSRGGMGGVGNSIAGNAPTATKSAPSSGNFARPGTTSAPTSGNKVTSGDDFFANFGN